MLKKSLYIEEGQPVSRLAASTIGRLNPLNLPTLLLTENAYTDPTRTLTQEFKKDRFKEHERNARLIEKYNPEALKDTVVRLGGVDSVDDLLWKKDRGENLPWYKRIGGRVLQNPKTGLIGKLLGYPSTFISNIQTPLSRASHYNPITDTVAEFMDEPAVTQHELGHALDFNTLYGLNPGKGSMLNRAGKGFLRDAYALFNHPYLPRFLTLLPEARANLLSDAALKHALGENSKKYKETNLRRQEVLPAGYGSYVGGALPIPGGPLLGMGLGKLYGILRSDQIRKELRDIKNKKKDSKKEKYEKERSKAASFGEMMGKKAAGIPSAAVAPLIGAAVGGLGTAAYDYVRGAKVNKLKRALIGAGLGGAAGAGFNYLSNSKGERGPKTLAPEPTREPAVEAESPVKVEPPVKVKVRKEDVPVDLNERALGRLDRERAEIVDKINQSFRYENPLEKRELLEQKYRDNRERRYSQSERYHVLHPLYKRGPNMDLYDDRWAE